LVTPNDPSAFADAMYRIAIDEKLWQQLRTNGMEHAKKFDISRFITIWSDMLLEIGK
jgi:glycosyltransferase involved in cell wall biosynthesis